MVVTGYQPDFLTAKANSSFLINPATSVFNSRIDGADSKNAMTHNNRISPDI